MNRYCFTTGILMMVLSQDPLQPLLGFSPSSKKADHHLASISTSPNIYQLFSSRDLSSFPEEMRRSNVPHFDILGAPIGNLVFCACNVCSAETVGGFQVAKGVRSCGFYRPPGGSTSSQAM